MGSRNRLLNMAGSQIEQLGPMGLKEAIRLSEGRTVCGQHLLFAGEGLVPQG